jgi:hypothetical protein
MSCQRHSFLDIDDHVFCEVCGDPPAAEQLAQIVAGRRDGTNCQICGGLGYFGPISADPVTIDCVRCNGTGKTIS